jgi:hypothetical protein
MQLEARGHPLHTRALAVVLAQRTDGKLDVRGSIVDLRKRGFVPVAGDLQGSGLIHDMRLVGVVDPATAVLEHIVAEQRNVAFEPSAATGGESCRDPIDRIRALGGMSVEGAYAQALSAAIGGPRGCTHLLTLGHLLGSGVARALERDRALHGGAPARPGGQRTFQRDLVIDGHEPAPGRLQLAAQLTDLHFAPAPALAIPMERFAGQLEVRVLAEITSTSGEITQIAAAERSRERADLERAIWRERSDAAAWLVGRRLGPGISRELLERLGRAPADRPLLDVLLMLAPALVQCAAALSEDWPLAARVQPSVVGMGGLADSCYMWRRGGALARRREAEGGSTPERR